MSKYIPGNQKHLTLNDRIYIENELNCYSAFCMLPPHHVFKQIKIRYTINYSDREYIRLIYAVPFVLS